MRITVCELPHEPEPLAAAWAGLCEHTRRHAAELVLLPECAFVPAFWEVEPFDSWRWDAAEQLTASWLARLPELSAGHVVGTTPIRVGGQYFNQGYVWSAASGVVPLRCKSFLPDEPGSWERSWFDPGEPVFPAYRAGELAFGLNICTELWALECYAAYAAAGVQAILAPRATSAAMRARWLSVGVVAAVRSGAYSVSSNRVDPAGACGGGGWIIGPDGSILAMTTPRAPFATVDVDLGAADRARTTYPRYVFRDAAASEGGRSTPPAAVATARPCSPPGQ